MGQLLVDENNTTKQSILSRIKAWWDADRESKAVSTAKGTGSSGEASTIEVGGDGNVQHITKMMLIEQALMYRYADYEQMDDYAELSSLLDIYADDSTVTDSIRNRTIWAESKDKTIREIIDDLLFRILNIEQDIWLMSRSMCKMGNLFGEILLTKQGVAGINWLPAVTMRRLVDDKGALIGFVQDTSSSNRFGIDTKKNDTIEKLKKSYADEKHLTFFHPWEIVHWRLRTKHIRSLYGYSVYDGARGVWRRLRLLEDTSLVHKLLKSPSRFAFYIDTGDLPPTEAMAQVRNVKQGYRKKTLINRETGKLDFRHDVVSTTDDMFIPTRGGKESTRIDVVGGLDWDVVDDLEYYRKRLLSSSKVPKGFFDDDGSDSRSSLAQKDVRFARTVMRVQRELKAGIRQIARLHLALLGIDPDSFDWDVAMSAPSSIFEMQQIEVHNARADLAERMKEYFPVEWILKRVMKLADDEATSIADAKDAEREKLAKEDARIQNDIQQMYPELVPVQGEGGEPPPANEEALQQVLSLSEYIKENIQNSGAVIKRIDDKAGKLLKESNKAGKRHE